MISALLWMLLDSVLTILGIAGILRLTVKAIKDDEKREWQWEKMETERLLQSRR